MRTKEATLTQRGRVEADQKQGQDWLDYFFFNSFFKLVVMDQRELFFISINHGNLPFILFYFVIQLLQ